MVLAGTSSSLPTAVVAPIVAAAGLLVSAVNIYIGLRNRKLDDRQQRQNRAAEQSYKYSKEAQNILLEVERYKRQQCGDSEQTFYKRMKELRVEEDWEIKEKITILSGFWRETIFLWKQGQLPSEFFEKENIWLYRGNSYRLLIEPVDIAGHYGLKFMSKESHYLDGNRPGRFVFLEELYECRKQKKPRSSIHFALMEQELHPDRFLESSKSLQSHEKLFEADLDLGKPATAISPELQKLPDTSCV